MPQPHLPAPVVPRPEPGAQLLEAVRQRQARPTLQLTQQWVHRRGVVDLQRFCSTELSSTLGPEAATWLQELLALDTPIDAAPPATSPSTEDFTATAAPSSATTGLTASLPDGRAGTQSDPSSSPEGLVDTVSTPPSGGPGVGSEPAVAPLIVSEAPPSEGEQAPEHELQARAMAAVDEAFAALSQSFQDGDQFSHAAAPLALTSAPAPAPRNAPEPLPVRGGLWPSLRASAASLSSALRPVHGADPAGPVAGRHHEPLTSLPEQQTAIHDASSIEAATSREPHRQESPTSQALPAPHPSDLDRPDDPAAQPDQPIEGAGVATEIASTIASAMPTGAAPRVGLLRRLRGRIETGGLTRLRTVMRDCVEETVALLRTPEQERGDDVEGFDVSQRQEPVEPTSEPPVMSWNLDPMRPPSAAPLASAGPSQPEAEQGTTAVESDTKTSTPSPPTRASRLRFCLPMGQPRSADDQPAPAPASLSDLQAWLPDRGDLPRAS